MKLVEERSGSELAGWATDGFRHEPHHSNVVTYGDPEERYGLSIEVDDPVKGYLVELRRSAVDGPVLARAIVEDRELAVDLAHEFAERADRYDDLPDLQKAGDRP